MKTFGILGDSYSTFKGYIVEGNRRYYPLPEEVEDVLSVEQTWWYQLMQRRNLRLLVNDSYSGATVCEDVREGYPLESAFTKRVIRSFGPETGEKPDIIFLFGCTNDYWFNRTMGRPQYSNWTEEDLQCTLPAYCYILDYLKEENPQARIVAIINDVFSPEIEGDMIASAEYYGAAVVKLNSIDKQNDHPTALGMEQIFRQVDAVLDNL